MFYLDNEIQVDKQCFTWLWKKKSANNFNMIINDHLLIEMEIVWDPAALKKLSTEMRICRMLCMDYVLL